MGKGDRVSGAWRLSLAAQMRPSFSLLPLEGGKKRGGGWPRETVLPHSRKPTPPRFARLPLPEEGARVIFLGSTDSIVVIRGQGLALPTHMPRTSPLSSSVFHAACALSAPSGHLPLEGKAAIRGYHPLKKAAKPPPSFLIPHSSKAFIQGQGTTPYGLTRPLYRIPQNRSVFSFAHFVSTSSETPMYCASVSAT